MSKTAKPSFERKTRMRRKEAEASASQWGDATAGEGYFVIYVLRHCYLKNLHGL